MRYLSLIGMSAIAALALALVPGGAMSQSKTLKEQVVGTWTLVSYDSIGNDGSKKAVFGAQPTGTLMIDASGRYAMVLADPGRTKWPSNLRTELSAEQLAAAAKGLVAQFGNWSIDEASKTMTRKVVGALNPSLAGAEQKVTIAISGDDLKVMSAASGVTGTRTEQGFKRAK